MTAPEGSTVEITMELNTLAAGQQALCNANGRQRLMLLSSASQEVAPLFDPERQLQDTPSLKL